MEGGRVANCWLKCGHCAKEKDLFRSEFIIYMHLMNTWERRNGRSGVKELRQGIFI